MGDEGFEPPTYSV